jgi:hypothetical protein
MQLHRTYIRLGATVLLADLCGFGLCKQPATRIVTTRAPIGRRVELLCGAHAQRRHELEEVLSDELILTGTAARQQSCEYEQAAADNSRRPAIKRIPRIVQQLADQVTRDRAVALQQRALCPACHRPQSSPSCASREHWGVA